MLVNPGTYRVRYTLQDAPGGTTTDQRAASGWVNPHAAASSPTATAVTPIATVYGKERELTVEEKIGAGLEVSEGYYQIRTHPDSRLTARRLLKREDTDAVREITHAPDHDPMAGEITLLARRAKL